MCATPPTSQCSEGNREIWWAFMDVYPAAFLISPFKPPLVVGSSTHPMFTTAPSHTNSDTHTHTHTHTPTHTHTHTHTHQHTQTRTQQHAQRVLGLFFVCFWECGVGVCFCVCVFVCVCGGVGVWGEGGQAM